MTALGLILLAYLVGSIPTGYWVAKALKNIDIRKEGSGSTGATNVLRCVGAGPAVFVFICDILKGFGVVWLAIWCDAAGLLPGVPLPDWKLIPTMVALVSLVGHSKSIFLGFQGGKSAATGLGTVLAMNPLAAVEAFGTWLAVLGVSRYVSLASILAAISAGIWMFCNRAPAGYVDYCILGAVYIILRHRANIRRLISGTEPRLGQKGDSDDSAKGQADDDEPK